jgi:biotin carboxyl carrier protein
MKYAVTVKDQVFEIEVTPEEKVLIGEDGHSVDLQSIDAGFLYSLFVDNNSYEVLIDDRAGEYRVLLHGELYTVQVEDGLGRRITRRRRTRAAQTGRIAIRAPMPGLVVAVQVAEGDDVAAGDVIVILESMKMENEVRAPRDGRVVHVQVCALETVEGGTTLVVLR